MWRFLISFAFLTPCFARAADYVTAVQTLKQVEGELRYWVREDTGGALAAKTMLRYIQAAKAVGVLELPVSISYSSPSFHMAEFGVTASGLRTTGAVQKTPVALSTTLQLVPNGNSVIVVNAVLPYPIRIAGYEGPELRATLEYFADTRKLRFSLETGTTDDQFDKDGEYVTRHGTGYFAEFDGNSVAPTSWSEIPFRVQRVGLINRVTKTEYEISCAEELRAVWRPTFILN